MNRLKCKNKTQKDMVNSMKINEVTMVRGAAGTGKTYVALSQALKMLQQGDYKKLIIAKSVTQLPGEEVGFLPGTIEEKMHQSMISYYKNMEKILGSPEAVTTLIEQGKLEILPLAFIRGYNIDDAIVIIDEAQNLNYQVIKTILTRIGEGSRYVFMGDVEQSDIKDSGYDEIINKMTEVRGVEIIDFTIEDIVRNEIITRMLKSGL